MPQLLELAERFVLPGKIQAAQSFGAGIINDTYLVTLAHTDGTPSTKVILQKINRQVFPQPEQIMANYRCVYDHIRAQLAATPVDAPRQFSIPALYRTDTGVDYHVDTNGYYWRATRFVENINAFDTLQSLQQAEEAGYALGMFHRLLSNLNINLLNDTLPGFHITPQYLQAYDNIDKAPVAQYKSDDVAFCVESIESGRPFADVLERAKQRLTMNVIHGDPKLNNILFHRESGQAVSIIDLDTVKPGLIHYDLGDCLRSCCNVAGELAAFNQAPVEFDLDSCRAILKGYFSVAREFLKPDDYACLFDAVWLLPYELGLRFFTDYLQGNVYFKVTYEAQNLHRAQTQFQLLRSIRRQEKSIRQIIANIKNTKAS